MGLTLDRGLGIGGLNVKVTSCLLGEKLRVFGIQLHIYRFAEASIRIIRSKQGLYVQKDGKD